MLIPNIDMMNNLIINPDLFGSQTEQESYVPPEISVLEINLEKRLCGLFNDFRLGIT
jgi:hypothetical protein